MATTKAKYAQGTMVCSIYGGVFTYERPAENGKHVLKDFLCDDESELDVSEFDKSRAKAWGRNRAI